MAAPAPIYVSPAAWARELDARARRGELPQVSKKSLHTARRIRRLPGSVILDLEAQEAPLHVFRWVAWTPQSNITEQRRRADLVLHLRRNFERAEDGWFREHEHKAAFDVWMGAIEQAGKRGLIYPRPEQVPAERYAEAIVAAAARPRRTRASPNASPLETALGDEATLRALARMIAAQITPRTT